MKATKASNQWLKKTGNTLSPAMRSTHWRISRLPFGIFFKPSWKRQSINLSVVPSSGNKWKSIGALKADVNACRRCRGESFSPSISHSVGQSVIQWVIQPVSEWVSQEMVKYSLRPVQRDEGRGDWLCESKATPLPLAYNLLLAGNKLKFYPGPRRGLWSHHFGNAEIGLRHCVYATDITYTPPTAFCQPSDGNFITAALKFNEMWLSGTVKGPHLSGITVCSGNISRKLVWQSFGLLSLKSRNLRNIYLSEWER